MKTDSPPDPRLLVGWAGADDAAVYQMDDERALVLTTDFFPPMVDDPYEFGAVAAANALSDVFAMGGKPLVALNLVAFPAKTVALEVLGEILRGGHDKVREAGAVIGGGHSVVDEEIKYGLAVTGEVSPQKVWCNGDVRIGDVLILTKPLGTGLINSAVKADGDDGPAVKEAIRWMSTLNGIGIEHLHSADVGGVTDVTGFGLLGHASELAEGSPATLVIRASDVPGINGIEHYFQDRLKTRSARETRAYQADSIELDDSIDAWTNELLFDPQTSGGLIVSIRPEDAESTVERLRESGLERTTIIGEAVAREGETRVRVI